MSFDDYIQHYIVNTQALVFLGFSAVIIAAAIAVILLFTRLFSRNYRPESRPSYIRSEGFSLIDRFSELIFSAMTIFLFVGIYFLIDFFGLGPGRTAFWQKWNSLLLLGLILLSILLNSFVDRVIIPLRHITPEERAAIRLVGMLYMIIIFVYIKYIYADNNYDTIIMYFLSMILGRFIYFDATFDGFRSAVADAVYQLPLLAVALGCTGAMAWFGFGSGYLLRSDGVVLNLMIAHLYMTVVLFIVQKTRLLDLFCPQTSNFRHYE